MLELGSPSADDLRKLGWRVAVHNDYRIGGLDCTFWLLTKTFYPGTMNERTLALKGEGGTDAEALDEIRQAINETHSTTFT